MELVGGLVWIVGADKGNPGQGVFSHGSQEVVGKISWAGKGKSSGLGKTRNEEPLRVQPWSL